MDRLRNYRNDRDGFESYCQILILSFFEKFESPLWEPITEKDRKNYDYIEEGWTHFITNFGRDFHERSIRRLEEIGQRLFGIEFDIIISKPWQDG